MGQPAKVRFLKGLAPGLAIILSTLLGPVVAYAATCDGRYALVLTRPIGKLAIEHAGGGFKASVAKRNAAAAAAEARYPVRERTREFDALLTDGLCQRLGAACARGGQGSATVRLAPLFLGYRFDQIRNVEYVATFVLDVDVAAQAGRSKKMRLGAGNTGRIKRVTKVKARLGPGYAEPGQIAYDGENSLRLLRSAVSTVTAALARELRALCQ